MDADFTTGLKVRFRDIDSMQHVNNAVYATYLEQVRAEYFDEVVDRQLSRVGTVLATLEIDFRHPIELGDPVTVGLSVPEMGTTSLTMEYEVRSDDVVAATATTVQVVWDRENQETRPIPDEWRERIEAARVDG